MADFKQAPTDSSTTTNQDTKDVDIAPSSGISVLVVGAGVGGLVTALECARKGHSVRIFEREKVISSEGDVFLIGMSARRWFSHWPVMAKELAQNSFKGAVFEYHKHSGEIVVPAVSLPDKAHGGAPSSGDIAGPANPPGPPMLPQLRPLFHKMLYDQIQRLGIEVVCEKRAAEYYETESRGGVVTADGERAEADIVVAADGIGSKAQNLILGEQVRGMYSGHSIYRTAFSAEVAFKDPLLKEHLNLIDGRPVLRAFYGPQTHSVVLTTPTMITWSLDHEGTEAGIESWRKSVDKEEVLQTMEQTPGWNEITKALVKITPPGRIVNYPLVFRNPQSKWASTHGRVIALGDNAHTFLPASGNGATQAIEDAITIASCLELAGGKESVPTAARAYVKLRFERVATAQRLGFTNKHRLQAPNWDEVKADPKKLTPLIPQWIIKHDPEKYAYENYGKVVESFTDGAPSFVSTNLPPGSAYKPWTMRELLEELENNTHAMDGDWS